MRGIFLTLLIFTLTVTINSQSKQEWFPKRLNVQPFTANFIEPKTGFHFMFDIDKVRLDIGTSSDILHISDNEKVISFGADLFTYTRLRSQNDFKFPVETVDYLFGLNAGYKIIDGNRSYGFRFRLSHISAHLVDGQYNQSQQQWRDGREPFVSSKEFVEFFPFYSWERLRVYAGLSYLFHVIPEEIGKGIYQLGFDYYPCVFESEKINPFIAYDFKISKLEKYVANHIISGGIKFGEYDSKGFSIIASYYAGKGVHGELFDLTENYASIGFNIDL